MVVVGISLSLLAVRTCFQVTNNGLYVVCCVKPLSAVKTLTVPGSLCVPSGELSEM